MNNYIPSLSLSTLYNSENNYLSYASLRCGINSFIGLSGYHSHLFNFTDDLTYRINANFMSNGQANLEHKLTYKLKDDLDLILSMVK